MRQSICNAVFQFQVPRDHLCVRNIGIRSRQRIKQSANEDGAATFRQGHGLSLNFFLTHENIIVPATDARNGQSFARWAPARHPDSAREKARR